MTTATAGTKLTTGSVATPVYGMRIGIDFVLDVTAAAAAAGDTLDVYVQGLITGTPASGNWLDIVHFTQVLGNGGAKRFIGKFGGAVAETMYDTSSTLAAGSVKTFAGDYYRCVYTVVDGGAHGQSFTWSCTALPY
jgi:hypothetical protein